MNTRSNEEYSDYTVRIRFRIPSSDYLGIDDAEICLGRYLEYGDLYLKSVDNKMPIKEADWLVVKVSGFPSEEVPSMADDVEAISIRTLANLNFGADFGRRIPGSFFFNVYLNKISEQTGRLVLNDEVGAMVFATELNPIVMRSGDLGIKKSVQSDRLIKSFSASFGIPQGLTERERMSFDLFTMAHKVKESADAQFVLLFAAIETLLEPSSRPQPSVQHVENLIALTKEAELPNNEKQSLLGTLEWLKNHSIRSSGKAFITQKLGTKEYGDFNATHFFLKCYDLRNRLVHGQQPHVDWREVSQAVGPLEIMVSDLLSGQTVNHHS